MRSKLYSLGSLTLIILMGLSIGLSNALAAEKKKKSAAKSTTSQTSNQQTPSAENTATVKKVKWEQEPTSFMGIELGQPLSKSVSTECPKSSYGLIDSSATESLGRLCHDDYLLKSSAGSYSVYSFQVPPIFK